MKTKKPSFALLPVARISVAAGLLVLVLAMMWGWRQYTWLDNELNHALQTSEADRRNILEHTVRDAVQTISFMRARTKDDLQQELREKTEQALAIAGGVHLGIESQAADWADTVRMALRRLSFDGDRVYLFAFDLDGAEQLYLPGPALGKGPVFVRGNERARVVAEMLDIVKQNGEGFYRYSKAGSPERDRQEVAFVKIFKPLGWMIGVGGHAEDFESFVKTQALDYLRTIKLPDGGSAFAGTWDGISLLGPDKGRNMWLATDGNGLKVVQRFVHVAKGSGGFVEYLTPTEKGGQGTRRITYVAGLPDWQWFVGAGASLQAIQSELALRRSVGRERILGEVGFSGLVAAMIIYLIVLEAQIVGGWARDDFRTFLGFLREAATKKEPLAPGRMQFAEFAELADAANRMISDHREALTVVEHQRAALDRTKDELEMRILERTRALEMQVIERTYAETELKKVNELLERRVEERTRDLRDQISARELVEDQFIQAQKMEAVGQLAGGLAHDFNNILTVIVGTLSTLRERLGEDDASHGAICLAQEATKRASDMTRRMLVFSREMTTLPTNVDLGVVMADMRPMIARALRESIEFSFECEPDLWTVHVDPVLLENAVLNIALNAQDAMPEGGRFTLRVANRHVGSAVVARHHNAQPGDYVEIAMSDTGTGIPPEILEKVFEPFFSTKAMGKGTGLGLSMVRTFAQRSNGFLAVDSEVGQGTTFSLFLPQSEVPAFTASEAETPSANGSLAGKRVLVVEDDPMVRDVTAGFLQSQDLEVVEAENGPAAVAALEGSGPFDLMVSDLIMPGGMSGVELHKLVQERWPQCPVVLMTGYSRDEFERFGVDPGSVRLLRKPFFMSELLKVVTEMIQADSVDDRAPAVVSL